jgi:hypothetical protein
MAQRGRLGTLQVGVGRQRLGAVLLRQVEQHRLQPDDGLAQPGYRRPGVEAEVERHLVVAAAPCVELAGKLGTEDLVQPPLHRGVDVFVALDEGEGAILHLLAHRGEPAQQRPRILLGDGAGHAQHPGMGHAAGDVLAIQATIDGQRAGELLHRARRSAPEPPSPEFRAPRTLLSHHGVPAA